jgi:hypothetical protein
VEDCADLDAAGEHGVGAAVCGDADAEPVVVDGLVGFDDNVIALALNDD